MILFLLILIKMFIKNIRKYKEIDLILFIIYYNGLYNNFNIIEIK